MFPDMSYFPGVAFFNRDVFTSRRRKIDGRNWRRNIEWNVVLPGQHGHHIGSDLVGSVAICGDSIGADDHAINFALLHHVAGHVVGYDRNGNIVFGQFPRG